MNRLGIRLFQAWAWLSGFILTVAAGGIIGYLLFKGGPVLGKRLIFGDTPVWAALTLQHPVFDGLLPAAAGTLVLVVLSVGLAVPLGLAAGIYLAEYCRGRAYAFLSLLFDILAGIPSIVVGLFGFSITLFLHRHFSTRIYPCLLVSALSLALLVLPYLIRTTQSALEGLAADLRLIAPSLGASKLQNIVHVLLPRSLGAIVSGVFLAIGRCAEDTAVIMLTGVVASAGVPQSLWRGYEALPFYIYYISAQYRDADELMRGYGAAVVLLLLCALLFGFSMLIKRTLAGRLFSSI